MRRSSTNRQFLFRVTALLVVLSFFPMTEVGFAAAPSDPPRQREFQFTYDALLNGLSPGQAVRVWLPVASTSPDQRVQIVAQNFPAGASFNTEPTFGNRICYFETKAAGDGTVSASITYHVIRYEVSASSSVDAPDAKQLAQSLRADANVPVGGKPLKLLAGKRLPSDPLLLARLLYDLVDDHLEYRKDKPGWGRGDAVWACESGFGNCSDFHSLFMSLARSQHIPAKFEIGFPLPESHGIGKIIGYHCWAKFSPAGGPWVPVDISEATRTRTCATTTSATSPPTASA